MYTGRLYCEWVISKRDLFFVELKTSPSSPGNVACGGGGDECDEKYEKGIPKHGDIMFHNFVVTIQENAGQIIR